jgi:hypothetical protein
VSSQRKTVFADILSKSKETERPGASVSATASGQAKKAKLNKAVDPAYIKLTAYIPRDLHFQMKTAMAEDQETDQSAYIERWIREKLDERHSATVSKRSRATG